MHISNQIIAKTIMKSQSHSYHNESYFMELKIRHTQKGELWDNSLGTLQQSESYSTVHNYSSTIDYRSYVK